MFKLSISTFKTTSLLISVICLGVVVPRVAGDHGQWDCQENEVFIDCGQCEGTCKEPIIANCSTNCKPARCECIASEGYVRSHDGACIRYDDCDTYVGIEVYSPDNPRMLQENTQDASQPEASNFPDAFSPVDQDTENQPSASLPSQTNLQENNYEDTQPEAPAPQLQNQNYDSSQAQQHFDYPPSISPNHPPRNSPYDQSGSPPQYYRRFRHRL